MKTISLALVLAGASMLSSGAMAQAYVSGGVGISQLSVDCSGFSSCDRNDVATKLTGGYGLGNGFALELGYIGFGKAKLSVANTSGDVKTTGITFGGAYVLPVAKNVDVGLRLGVASLKTKFSALGRSESDTKTAAYAGVGVGYKIQKNLKVEAGIDFSRAGWEDEKFNVRALTVGARYDF